MHNKNHEVWYKIVRCPPLTEIYIIVFFFALWHLSQICATLHFIFQMCNNILQQKIILRRRKQFCTLRAQAQGLLRNLPYVYTSF